MKDKNYVFENFETNLYNQRAFTVARDFVNSKKVEQIGIFGMEGVGKTRLLILRSIKS